MASGIDQESRINRNVSELSKKLLEGCKLLSDSCPETNVPLVSTKDGRMYSVGNGHYYARNGNELHKLPPDTAPAAHTMLAPPTPTSPSFSSTNHLLAAPEPGQLDSRLSQLVAQKLLEGCTLLSESCEVTSVPLVQDQQGRIISVRAHAQHPQPCTALSHSTPHPSPRWVHHRWAPAKYMNESVASCAKWARSHRLPAGICIPCHLCHPPPTPRIRNRWQRLPRHLSQFTLRPQHRVLPPRQPAHSQHRRFQRRCFRRFLCHHPRSQLRRSTRWHAPSTARLVFSASSSMEFEAHWRRPAAPRP